MSDSFGATSQSPSVTDINPAPVAWKVLIADDDAAVHQVTRMVMSGFQFDQQPVQFLSAYSGAEACQMMKDHPDIAMILLDVVMETDEAGLEVARYIRQELGNHAVRIVLRTGQPGQAPEEDVIRQFDINDYKDKTELTKTKLVTLFFSALRSFRDITSAKHTRTTASVSEETAEETQSCISIVAGMAHELGTPLGVCLSSLSFLQEKLDEIRALSASEAQSEVAADDLLAESQEAVTLTLSNLERAIGLVKSYKSIAAHRSVQAVSSFRLEQLLADLVQSLHFETRKKVGQLSMDCPSELMLETDAGALVQILTNLIINSLKHGFLQQPVKDNRISIDVNLRGNEAEILYRDNGVGIPAELQPMIFDPFFTTGRAGGGTGVGLSVARELAEERLKGQLSLSVEPNQAGVLFRLSLPIKLPMS